MKQAIIILQIVFLCLSVNAQKLELSLSGGGNYTFIKTRNSPRLSGLHNTVSPYGSFKISYSLKDIKFGVRVDAFNMTMKGTVPYVNYLLTTYPVKANFNFFAPCINPMIFAEKDFSVNDKLKYFFGINAGILYGFKSTFDLDIYNGMADVDKSSFGYSIGIQTGISYSFLKKYSLLLETAPRFIKVTKLGTTDELMDFNIRSFEIYDDRKMFNTFSIPLSIGISVKL